MTCRATVRRERTGAGLTADQIDTFLNLARQGDEATFRELALCLGVRMESLDELWTGMVVRIALDTPGRSGEHRLPQDG